jgi:hypothetical protein
MGMYRPAIGLVLAALLAAGLPDAGADSAASSVDRIPRDRIRSAALEIDRLVEADLREHALQPNPLLDDASFVRRIHLDLVGRIPTAAEVSAFVEEKSEDKREVLIDRLLASPGYTSHLFNWMADLLRVKTRLTNNVSGEPYIHFIKESIASGKPYDQFVREMLTASGPAHQRGHGATGYYLRDSGMPEDNMSNTITIFLGTRLECAQCHNHPFDTWTQLQYHEMVAFTGGMSYRDDTVLKGPQGERLHAMGESFKSKEKGKETRSAEYQAFRKILQPLEYGITGSGTGLYRLPKNYQYTDAEPNQIVKAKTMFGAEASVQPALEDAAKRSGKTNPKTKRAPAIKAPEVDSRRAYAEWLTSADNPRFTTVIANRLWKRFFGAGVIEPVDNLRANTKPVNGPLMAHLETTLKEVGYDLRQYLRILVNSRVYQREASRREASDEGPYRFPGPLLRRMTAEQLWDSMVTLVVPDLDATIPEPAAAAEPIYAAYDALLGLSEEQVKAQVEVEALRRTDPKKYRELQQKQREEARLAQKNDAELQEKTRTLEEAMKAARKKGDEAEAKRLRAELQALAQSSSPGSSMSMMMNPGNYRRPSAARGLARASELSQPERPGHFLREFGQSDREQIEASHTDSSAPQALSLLNGFVDKTILPNAKSAVRLAADASKDPEVRIAAVFRSTLSRDPSAAERDVWKADVAKRGDAAIKDLIWTLVNTHEFMFIR